MILSPCPTHGHQDWLIDSYPRHLRGAVKPTVPYSNRASSQASHPGSRSLMQCHPLARKKSATLVVSPVGWSICEAHLEGNNKIRRGVDFRDFKECMALAPRPMLGGMNKGVCVCTSSPRHDNNNVRMQGRNEIAAIESACPMRTKLSTHQTCLRCALFAKRRRRILFANFNCWTRVLGCV